MANNIIAMKSPRLRRTTTHRTHIDNTDDNNNHKKMRCETKRHRFHFPSAHEKKHRVAILGEIMPAAQKLCKLFWEMRKPVPIRKWNIFSSVLR